MQQIFVTPDSIYAQLWDLARKPKDGQDVASHWKEMVAQQVYWAMLIQACAPGSSVSVSPHYAARCVLLPPSSSFGSGDRMICLPISGLTILSCVSCSRSS